MEHKKHIRSTKSQIRFLCNYMATHKTFAKSLSLTLSPAEASKKTKEWSSLRAVLRKYGPDKSVHQWKQTWRDVKRNMTKRKLEENKNVETLKTPIVIDYDTLNNELEPKTKQQFPVEFVGPHESFDTSGASIKEEPSYPYGSPSKHGGASIKEEPSTHYPYEFNSNNVNLDIPCSSPMQIILTNTDKFTFTSSASTQTPLNLSFYTQTPSTTSSAICENTLNPSNCAYNSSRCSCPHAFSNHSLNGKFSVSTTNHCHPQCCRQRETDNLKVQQNIMLQKLCNLLEEQNSILRMRNRIERSKIRFQNCRRL